ncbi:MAG TPA: TonB-dependent receptor [Candidatus Acidoferrales bacterium]|nr:TonB-dependent receptor [Candidatus Acidoferrales bacterium]
MSVRALSEKTKVVLSLLLVLVLSMAVARRANAQVAGATLTGTVTDTSGAILPNAQVTITDVATGVTRIVTSNAAGLYIAPNLLPGTYEVKVAATGFKTQLQKGITLTVGAEQLLDITMQVGQMSQTVEVTTEAPTVELTSSELGATVSSTTVRELPLNGRSWTDLAALQPGVVGATSHPKVDVNRGYGGQLSISGARPQQNNYRLDGISINDYSNGGPGSVLGQNLGVEAIQEFSVLTSNYSAEYGKTSGGVVNAISRSGTNQFHGSVYEFLRNSALDADNFFDNANGLPKPPFRRNQFGVSAGGPIRKDHTFIFGDYEGIRQSQGTTQSSGVPSANARLGILTGGTPLDPTAPCALAGSHNLTATLPTTDPNYGKATTCVDDKVARYMPFFNLPNTPTTGNVGQYVFPRQQVVSENYYTARVDEKISEKDSLFGSYVYDYAPLTEPDILNNILVQSITKRQIAAFEENHVFSAAIGNSFRLGYNRDHADAGENIKAINPAAAVSTGQWAPGYAPPRVISSGLNTVPGLSPPAFTYVWDAYQVYDDAFVTKGLHTLKFGVGVERDHLNETTTTGDFLGTFRFGAINNFLQNKPGSVVGSIPGLVTPRYMRLTIAGAYVQDDWRFRPNLTLNLGLRYEMATVIKEKYGKLTNLPTLDAQLPTCGTLATGCGSVGPYFSNPTLNNFEPRLGFAWDPFKTGKTAVRGGFGMFDVLPMLYTTVTLNGRGAPFFQLASPAPGTSLPQGSFPDGALPFILNTAQQTGKSAPVEYGFIEHHPHRNYVMQWNLNVQHQITPSLTAMVGYVGSHGVHQAFRADDGNIVLPTLNSATGRYLWPKVDVLGNIWDPTNMCTQTDPNGSDPSICAPPQLVNSNSNVGGIRYLSWPGSSSYNALQVGIKEQMSHGVQIQGSFTWGKSMDNNSGVIAGDTFGNGIGSLTWFDLKLSRAVSDYNVPRVLVVNASWVLPTNKSIPPALGWVVNGWELGGILKVADGPPFTATFGTAGGDPLGIASTDPWAYPDRLGGAGCSSLANPGNPNQYIKTQCFSVPTAPNAAFWNANCDPAPPSLGGTVDPNSLQCFNLRGNAGRNIIQGPGLVNLDFSAFKNNPIRRISETFNVQFRAEIFNIINHANFSLPIEPDNTDVFDNTGAPTGTEGLITTTSTDSRQIQFALKVIW